MNDWPARIDPDETAIGRQTPTARRLVEASVSPNTRRGLRRRAPASRRLARRARAPRRDPGRLPRRAARRRARLVERVDGGRRGLLPREAGRAARSRRRADGPGARRLPADRQRSPFSCRPSRSFDVHEKRRVGLVPVPGFVGSIGSTTCQPCRNFPRTRLRNIVATVSTALISVQAKAPVVASSIVCTVTYRAARTGF